MSAMLSHAYAPTSPENTGATRIEQKQYPTEFVEALTEGGYLSVLIPEEYGGAGMDIGAACAILEEIQRSGANGGACHAQMYTMGTVLRHGSDAQKASNIA